MCVGAGVQLQVLHVFAVQLHVELLQGAVPLPESRLQAQDPLHVLLHQAGLRKHTFSTPGGARRVEILSGEKILLRVELLPFERVRGKFDQHQ